MLPEYVVLHSVRRHARLIATVGLVSCTFPADVGREISVTITSPPLALIIGDTLRLTGEVRRGSEPVALPIAYGSSNEAVAVVSGDGLLRAVGVGTVAITARAVGYEAAGSAALAVQVFRPVRIDTVLTSTPPTGGVTTVKWGERITVIGFGLDTAGALVVVGSQAPVIESFTPGDPSDTANADTLRLWVPALTPDSTKLIVARLTGNSAGAQWPLRVVQQDIYEPNEQTPTTLGSIAAAFFNPGLALEVVAPVFSPAGCASVWGSSTPGECWFDDYRIARPSGAANDSVTIVFRFTRALRNSPVSIETRNSTGPQRWLVGRNFSLCLDDRGSFGAFYASTHEFDALRDSFTLALAGVGGEPLALSATLFGRDFSPEVPWPGAPTGTLPYQLSIYPGYRSTLPPDAAEENDFCHGAPELALPGDTLDLTFDTGTDLDWFHFTVPVPAPASGAHAALSRADVTESEPNNTWDLADTVQLGDRVLGTIDPAGDTDWIAFYADSGQVLDVEVTAERNGSGLDGTLVLISDLGVLALNREASIASLDPRITIVAPASGWYAAGLVDAQLRGGPGYPYEMTVSPATAQASLVTAELCCATTPGARFSPQLQLWGDLRLTEGGILPVADRGATLTFPVLPGEYFLLAYNRAADATAYQLRFAVAALQPATPVAPLSALPTLLAANGTPRVTRTAGAGADTHGTSYRRLDRRALRGP